MTTMYKKINRQIEVMEETLEAWQEKLNAEKIANVLLGPEYCPCCMSWRITFSDGINCSGCPIKEFTGFDACDLTPYEEVRLSKFGGDDEVFFSAVQKEIDFLTSVLNNLKQEKELLDSNEDHEENNHDST